jgi:hypothetical protein
MGRALLDSPVLHGVGDHVSDGGVDGTAFFDGLGQGLIDLFGQTGAHDVVIEDHTAEQLGDFFRGHSDILSVGSGRGRAPNVNGFLCVKIWGVFKACA